MRFSYKAITPKGEKISGTAEAGDKYELAHQVRGQGNTLISAEALDVKMALTFRALTRFCRA